MNLKLFEGKIEKEWLDKLAPFLQSEKFDDIMVSLKKEAALGKTICPESKFLFRAFKECKYDDLKTVIVLQDPYYQKGVGDGIPMSCSNTNKLQPSLQMWYKEIERTIYNGKMLTPHAYDPDLTYLANQGVLLLNAALTVEEKIPRSHTTIWKPFMEYLFRDILSVYNSGLPIVFLGATAAALETYVAPFLHYTKTVEHPAAASYQKREWNSDDMFNWVNHFIERNNGPEFKIQWA